MPKYTEIGAVELLIDKAQPYIFSYKAFYLEKYYNYKIHLVCKPSGEVYVCSIIHFTLGSFVQPASVGMYVI